MLYPYPTFSTPLDRFQTLVLAPHTAGSSSLIVASVTGLGSPTPTNPVRITCKRASDAAFVHYSVTGIGGAGNTLVVAVEDGYSDIDLAADDRVAALVSAGTILEVQNAVDDLVTAVNAIVVEGGPQGNQGNQGVAGTDGVQGRQGSAGAQGHQGSTGAQGSTGSQGNQGVGGSVGTQGRQGFQGAAGTDGTQGHQGSVGAQGSTGNQGSQGSAGVDGTQGHQGSVGVQGSTGSQGNQGVGGSSGQQGNQGVAGADGAQGTQGRQGLQGAAGQQGNQGVVGSTGADGTQGTQGSTGSDGAQGRQGVQGVGGTQGNQGAAGADGAQGNQGRQGSVGSQGNQGVAGTDGTQGHQGSVGVQGSTGSQGSQGAAGSQGNQGSTGVQGSVGQQGSTGSTGSAGATGSQGNQGVAGADGAQGRQGVQGTTGSQGNQGVGGSVGLQGSQGLVGAQGLQGSGGVQGSVGQQGSQGLAGPQGDQGTRGFQGTDGGQGNQGYQGLVGPQGLTGAGTQGVQGSVGVQGNQGLQGLTGAGTQGDQGSTGVQGDQGDNGNQGPQGRQGFQGGTGVQGQQGFTGVQGSTGSQGSQGLTGTGTQGVQGSTGAQGVQGAVPGVGSTTQVIYNSSGSLTGNAAFTYTAGTSTLAVTSASNTAISGITTSGVALSGAASGVGIGVAATSLSGQAGAFEQVGTLTANTTNPTLLALRASTLGSFTSTGPVLQVEDSTAATGPLIRCLKQGVVAVTLDNKGLLGLGTTSPTAGLHTLGGGIKVAAVAQPALNSLTVTGTSGSTSYFYGIVVEDRAGNLTLPSVSGTVHITTAPATLSGTNFVTAGFNAAPGAYNYHLIRSTASTSLLAGTTGLYKVGSVQETGLSTYSISDQSNTLTTFTVPARNLTADLTGDGLISSTVSRSDGPAIRGINNGSAAGVRGDSILGAGVNGASSFGSAGLFSTSGTLLNDVTTPTVSASRGNSLSTFDMTGPIAYLEDTTASTGDFLSCVLSGSTIFGVTKTGMLRGDAVAGLPVCGRLSLTSGTPVTISDVTSGTSIYFSPFRGNTIPIYNTVTTTWDLCVFSTLSASISGLTANTLYDVFISGNNAGATSIQLVAWSSNTARATALVLQDGVLCLTGSLNERYVGTIRINSGGGSADDSIKNRNVWNYYNRIARRWHCIDSSASTYTIAATGTSIWQFCRGTASTCQGSIVLGVSEDLIDFHFSGAAVTPVSSYYGIGINIVQGTTGAPTPSTTSILDHGFRSGGDTASTNQVGAHGHYQLGSTTVGYFLVTKLEYGEGGTVTVLPNSTTGSGTYEIGGMNCMLWG